MLNVIAVTGRLTKEPELRKTAGGQAYANFAIAIDTPSKNEDGERGTCFLDCIAFKSVAENVCECLHKGSKVAVHGAINQRDFIRKDGNKGRAYEIICSGVEFLDPKQQDPEEPDEDDLPFDPTPVQETKFDPYTGKPLKSSKKK